ncbi:MAG: helix-turn-helix domain-containing protein, partial [Pseudonocardiaceae bacterium]
MSESAAADKFDCITSSAHLGSLLRRLRGRKTQQNIADHAKRHNFYVHRPDLSAIERGHRLPTANELRGILHGCGRIDLFDDLDRIRQQLMSDPPMSSGSPREASHPQVSHPQVAPPDPADEAGLGVRSPEKDNPGRGRTLVIAVFIAAAVAITTVVILTGRTTNAVTQSAGQDSSTSSVPLVQLDIPAAIEAAREAPLCAEKIVPDSGVASTVLAQDTGPADAVDPNRLIELRAHHDSQHGWIAWAHLARSASDRDRLWMDWSYLPLPTERNQWRQCGPHPLSSGPDSPAVKAVD